MIRWLVLILGFCLFFIFLNKRTCNASMSINDQWRRNLGVCALSCERNVMMPLGVKLITLRCESLPLPAPHQSPLCINWYQSQKPFRSAWSNYFSILVPIIVGPIPSLSLGTPSSLSNPYHLQNLLKIPNPIPSPSLFPWPLHRLKYLTEPSPLQSKPSNQSPPSPCASPATLAFDRITHFPKSLPLEALAFKPKACHTRTITIPTPVN